MNIYTTLEDRKKANAWRNQYYDKLKQNKLNQPSALAGNTLNGTAATTPSSSGSGSSKSGGSKSSTTTSNKTAGVFDNIKLPYEDTVAQKNAQKAADLKRQQEQYNAQKLAEKQAAEAKAAQEKYAREKYIAQMRQKQRDEQLKGTGMQSSNAVRSNPFTSAVPKLNYTPGKIEVRSAVTQSQWNKGVSGQNNTADINVVKNNIPKATKAEQDAFINKYLPKLMGTENTSKSSYGPNSEMADTVKIVSSKTTVPKTVTAPKQTVKAAGPNAEMGNSVVLENQKWKPEIGTGPNVEISQKNFLDHRENNIFKSYFDEYRYDKIIENAYKPQEEYFVGKDSIYKKEPKEISEDYRKVYNAVQPEYLKKKEELADLEFYKKYARLDEEGLKNLEKTKSDVEKLDFIRKKAAFGAKLNYIF